MDSAHDFGADPWDALEDPANFADPGALLGSHPDDKCRYAVVNTALRDAAHEVPEIPLDSPMSDLFGRWLIYTNGEKHRRLRRRFSGYFGPRQASAFAPRAAATVRNQIDRYAAVGELDAVEELTRPAAFSMICESMGVPSDDREELRVLDDIFNAVITRQDQPEWVAKGEHATKRIMDMFESMLASRMEAPTGDFLSDLVAEPLEASVELRDVAANCMFLVTNSQATMPTMAAGGLSLLLDHPRELELVRAGAYPMEDVVEELVRLITPVPQAVRTGQRNEEWHYWMAGANRDRAVFHDPDAFNPTRRPNRHLSFLVGPHSCLGAAVARQFTSVVLEQVLALPGLRRAGPTVWSSAVPTHRVGRVPIAWDVG